MDILALFPCTWEWGYGYSCKAEIWECGLCTRNACWSCMIHGWSHVCWWRKAEGTLRDMSNPHLQRHFYSQKYSGLHIVLVTMRIVFLSLPWATASKCRLHSLPGKSQLNFQAPISVWDHYLSSKMLQWYGEGLATSLYQMITKTLTMIQKLQWGSNHYRWLQSHTPLQCLCLHHSMNYVVKHACVHDQ